MAGPGMQGFGNGQGDYFPGHPLQVANSYPHNASYLMLFQPQQSCHQVPLHIRPQIGHHIPPSSYGSHFQTNLSEGTYFAPGSHTKAPPVPSTSESCHKVPECPSEVQMNCPTFLTGFNIAMDRGERRKIIGKLKKMTALRSAVKVGQEKKVNAATEKTDTKNSEPTQNERTERVTGVRDGTAELMNMMGNSRQTFASRGIPASFQFSLSADSSSKSELNPNVEEFTPTFVKPATKNPSENDSNIIQRAEVKRVVPAFDPLKFQKLNLSLGIPKNNKSSRDTESQTSIEGVEFDKELCDGCRMKLNNFKASTKFPAQSNFKKISLTHKIKYVSIQASVFVTESPALLDKLEEMKAKLKEKLQNTCKLFQVTPTDKTEMEDEALCIAAIILLKEEPDLAHPSKREKFLSKLTDETKNHLEIGLGLMSETSEDRSSAQIQKSRPLINAMISEKVPETHRKSTALPLNPYGSLQPRLTNNIPLNISTSMPETAVYSQGIGAHSPKEQASVFPQSGLDPEKELEGLINYQNHLMQQLILMKNSGCLDTNNQIQPPPVSPSFPGIISPQRMISPTNLEIAGLKNHHNFKDPREIWNLSNNSKESLNRNADICPTSVQFLSTTTEGNSSNNFPVFLHSGNTKQDRQRDNRYQEMSGVPRDVSSLCTKISTRGRGKRIMPPLDLRPSKLHNKDHSASLVVGGSRVLEKDMVSVAKHMSTIEESEVLKQPDDNLTAMLSKVNLSGATKPAQNMTHIFSHSECSNASDICPSMNLFPRKFCDQSTASGQIEHWTDSLASSTKGFSKPVTATEVPKSRKLLTPLQRKRLKMALDANPSLKPLQSDIHCPPEVIETSKYGTTNNTPSVATLQTKSALSQTAQTYSAIPSNTHSSLYNAPGSLPISTTVISSSAPSSKSSTSFLPVSMALKQITDWQARCDDTVEVSQYSSESSSHESVSGDQAPLYGDTGLLSDWHNARLQPQSRVSDTKTFKYTGTWDDHIMPESDLRLTSSQEKLQSGTENVSGLSENNYEKTHFQKQREPKILSYKDCLVTNIKHSEEAQPPKTVHMSQEEGWLLEKDDVCRMLPKVSKRETSNEMTSRTHLTNNQQNEIQGKNESSAKVADKEDTVSENSDKSDRDVKSWTKQDRQKETNLKTGNTNDINNPVLSENIKDNKNNKYGLDDFILTAGGKKPDVVGGSEKKGKKTKTSAQSTDSTSDSDDSSIQEQVQEDESKDGSRYPDVKDAEEEGWQTVTKQNKVFKKQIDVKLTEFRSQEKYTNLTNVILEIHKFLSRKDAQSVLETVFIATSGMTGMRQPQILKEVKLVVKEEFPDRLPLDEQNHDSNAVTELCERKDEEDVAEDRCLVNNVDDLGRTRQPIDKDCKVQ